ncbi:MAG: PorV/PorQ family protein [Ignavibacteria bacterium]|nr:PorV/PorQ family protein [Bacteroidota bacterium]MSQ46258.1 PorV/PorQ family protein [Ignavibacteria bacterium]
MKIRNINKKIILGLIIISQTIFSQQFNSNVSKKGTTAATFLSIGQGARALSMGSAFVAVADDPSSMFWNVAGITDIQGNSVAFEHTNWLSDIKYNYFAGTISLNEYGTIGASFTSSNINEMKVTTVDKPEGNGESFSVSDVAFSLAYGIKLTDKFSIGFNPKYVYQKIWKMSASAFAIDMGIKYETPFDGAILGMSISNFGTKMQMQGTSSSVLFDPDESTTGNNGKIPANLATGEWALPLNFKVGVAYNILNEPTSKLLIAVDASHPSDNYESIDFGAEYILMDFLAIRSGYKSMLLANSEEGFAFGIGVKQAVVGSSILSFDYGFQDFGILKNTQKFSIGILF